MINRLISSSAGPLIRHALTVASGYLAAQGLPGLADGTVANLTDLAIAAVSLLVALAWSYAEKAIRPKPKA